MTESRPESSPEPIHLKLDALPSDVVQRIREVQDQDPEFLRRILLYGITHRTVFETLESSWTT